jgi:hypothetical protein
MRRRFLYDLEKFIGVFSKQFIKNNCGPCFEGQSMIVDQDMVGGPFFSTKSQEDANAKAQAAVEANGQAYANKNGTCTPLSTDPVWEDVEPEELRCSEGKSQKKQRDTNECSETHNQERWVDGGNKVCSWTGVYSRTFTKRCADGGTGSSVTINQSQVTGGPFISFISQEDANNKAKTAVEQQGQALADAQGTCTWTGKASKAFTRNNCGSCYHGSSFVVNQDHVGGPFTSNISKADADAKALAAVNSKGQSVANNNASCIADSKSPSWSDTGSTRCDGCTSQKQQRDTNPCSSSYNNTRWVNGGGESCTSWNYYGTGDCVGHTQYNMYKDDCSGDIDRQYSVSCRNCCNCGSYGSWSESGCGTGSNSNKVKYVRYDDCGRADYKYELEPGKCGYNSYEFKFPDGTTTKSWSGSGLSQNIQYAITSIKNGSYIGYSVKSKPSWCSVDYRNQTSTSMDAIITMTFNTSTSPRSGTIVFVQNESGKIINVNITQDIVSVFTFNDGTASDKAWSGTAASQTIKYTILSTIGSSYAPYSVKSKPEWCSVDYDSPTDKGALAKITMTANTSTSSSRQGKVVFSQNATGKTLTVIIEQAKASRIPAHITLKNGSWASYTKSNVSYNAGAGKCIAGFEWTGDENGTIRIYTCDIKVVDSNYSEISGATISTGTITSRVRAGNSCTDFGAVNGGILAGYVHSGDETKNTTWYLRTIKVSYEGKTYTSSTVRQYSKDGIPKKGGTFNVYNQSPSSYNFIVDGAECGDERGTLRYFYSQIDLK